MPWRDHGIRLSGPIVIGMRKHFLKFWNHNNNQYNHKITISENFCIQKDAF